MKNVSGLPIRPPKLSPNARLNPHDHPEDADDRHGHEALEHRRDHVAPPDHAAVEEREPRRHEQHQPGRRQHPRDVRRIDWSAWPAGLAFRQRCTNGADGKK